MSNHTPGPWVAQGHKVYGPSHHESKHPNGRIFIADVARGTHRADPLLDGGADRFEFDSETDVRLIAAAPEMLEMLLELQECASYWSEYDVPLGIKERLDEAIRKARGEE